VKKNKNNRWVLGGEKITTTKIKSFRHRWLVWWTDRKTNRLNYDIFSCVFRQIKTKVLDRVQTQLWSKTLDQVSDW